MKRKMLYGRTLEELLEICYEFGLPDYAAGQMADWIYKKRVTDIDAFSNIGKAAREKIKMRYEVGNTKPVKCVVSKDGTKKYIFNYDALVESVVIFDGERKTLCVSSQAGCRIGCSFCATGDMGFKKNLSPYEILNLWRCAVDMHDGIDNVVFMGMGEPLDNWQNVKTCIEILTSKWGYAISPHRITVSTCGIEPSMKSLLDDTQCNVAVSLHSAISVERAQIMKVENAYPIERIVSTLRRYDWNGQRRLTFEYIVFDFNQSMRHVEALVRLLRGLECRINLINYHSIKKFPFKGADRVAILNFKDVLNERSLRTVIRISKGEDIFAACGMLSARMAKEEFDSDLL